MKKICIATVLLTLLALLGACSAANHTASSFDLDRAENSMSAPAPQTSALMGMDESAYEREKLAGVADSIAPMDSGAVYDGTSGVAASPEIQPYTPDISLTDPNRKLIYTANLSVETQLFDESVANIEALCATFQGFIESSSIDGVSITMRGKQYRGATYSLRIPSKFFNEFINSMGTIGNVINKSQNTQDITESYYDIESRLKILEMRRDRLFELLDKETGSKAIIEFENSLSETLYEIESLTGSLRKYDSLVDYSIVHVYLTEVEELTEINNYKPAPKTIGERIKSAFGDSTNTISNFLVDVFVFLVGNILYIIVWTAIITICVIIFGTIRKRHRQRKQKAPKTDNNNNNEGEQ